MQSMQNIFASSDLIMMSEPSSSLAKGNATHYYYLISLAKFSDFYYISGVVTPILVIASYFEADTCIICCDVMTDGLHNL